MDYYEYSRITIISIRDNYRIKLHHNWRNLIRLTEFVIMDFIVDYNAILWDDHNFYNPNQKCFFSHNEDKGIVHNHIYFL